MDEADDRIPRRELCGRASRDVADQQQAVVFTSLVCVTDGVINLLLKIKASQLMEVKSKA